MATVSPAFSVASGVVRTVWTGIVTGDTINAFTLPAQAGMFGSVQISGTFSGATVTFQGSNDGTNWFTLNDFNGTAISATAAALREVRTSAVYVRPAITGGSGNSVDVICAFRGK
jgi:hypothetical protein